MDGSLFVLLLSGLFWSGSALYRAYHYINVGMSWPEAQRYCREWYTDLATVDTMDDVNRLVNIVDAGYNGSVWIGLKRVTQKRWAWSNGQNKSLPYSNWAPGEPNGNGHCLYMANGFWYDGLCQNDIMYFMCYKENGYFLVQILKTWSDAQSYCRQYYTDLAFINNSEENNKIKALIPINTWWIRIGLFLDSWEWSDKWSLFFRNWVAGPPSPTPGYDCVSMSKTNGKWAHESCDLKRPFICYGEKRKQFVRLKLSCNGECKLNAPSVQTAILNKVCLCLKHCSVSWSYSGAATQFSKYVLGETTKDEPIQIHEKLKSMGLESDSKISWRKREGGEVFNREINHVVNSNNTCRRYH